MYLEKIRKVLSEKFDVEPEEINLTTNIFDDLGADSLDIVDLLMTIEDEFGIVIPDEAAQDIKTVGNVVDYLEEHAKD
jgi:acyl carrier protein